jgi:hypothetical protein
MDELEVAHLLTIYIAVSNPFHVEAVDLDKY